MSEPTTGILLDIEGTTSSISFVYDRMFPYARRWLRSFLDAHWNEQPVQAAVQQIARDAGFDTFDGWRASQGTPVDGRQLVESEVLRLMNDDVKSTGLKSLQGLIWREGFESGELKAHVYPDVAPALRKWTAAGRDIRIYSSGSIHAQQLFFAHTIAGDLLTFIRRHYDTTTGPKREVSSYQRIAQDFDLPASDITFYSDVPAELDAARLSGMQTRLCCRPGNAEVDESVTHTRVSQFA